MSVYLYLFHGRATPDEDVESWGCEGPAIGPLDYVHTTYGSEVKIRGAEAILEKLKEAGLDGLPRDADVPGPPDLAAREREARQPDGGEQPGPELVHVSSLK